MAGAVALGVATLVAVVFAPSIQFGFISYDDTWFLSGNPRIWEGLTLENLRYAFTTREMGYPKPLTILSWMLDATVYGEGARGLHASNVIFHAAGAAALFAALRAATGAVWLSALAAALWALHPLRVESVAWLAQRKDVLSALFGFLGLWAYARYGRFGGPGRFGLVVLALIASLLCKPPLVTLPVLLLLWDWWPLGRLPAAPPGTAPRRRIRALLGEKALLMLPAAGYAAWMWALRDNGGAADPFGERLANALVSVPRYLARMVWFGELAIPYADRVWSLPQIAGAALVVGGLLAGAVAGRRRMPAAATGVVWFLLALGPTLGIIPLAGNYSMADRYTHWPSIGLAWAVAFSLPVGMLAGRPARRGFAVALAGIVVVALSGYAVGQLGYWQNSVTLFRHTLAVGEHSPTAYLALAHGYRRLDHPARAEAVLQRAMERFPRHGRVHAALAHLQLIQGRPQTAARLARRAAELDPDHGYAHAVAGIALYESGAREAARPYLERALELDPAQPGANVYRGRLYAARGDWEKAIPLFRRALEAHPDYAKAQLDLARAYHRIGRDDAARRLVERVLRFHPVHERARRLRRALDRDAPPTRPATRPR